MVKAKITLAPRAPHKLELIAEGTGGHRQCKAKFHRICKTFLLVQISGFVEGVSDHRLVSWGLKLILDQGSHLDDRVPVPKFDFFPMTIHHDEVGKSFNELLPLPKEIYVQRLYGACCSRRNSTSVELDGRWNKLVDHGPIVLSRESVQ
jgi:hypothetical protein